MAQCWNNGRVAKHILPMPMPGQANDSAQGRCVEPGHCEGQIGRTFDLGLEVGSGPWTWMTDAGSVCMNVYECEELLSSSGSGP